MMRSISNISKRLSESVVGLALVATPLSFLARPVGDESPITSSKSRSETKSGAPSIAQTSSLGRFLESEVSTRIERVSGRRFGSRARTQNSREIASAVAEASYLYDVDPFLLLSMIEVESRYHTDAVGLHGEIGLMQIKPSTARWVAPVTDALYDCDLHQIRCNVMMGASYVGHLQHKVEKQRSGDDESIALNLATAPKFREHVLRSYNLGPAKANRLASDRTPANEGETPSYATKIAWRTDRMRQRYFIAVLNDQSGPKNLKRAPESISTVAMIH